MSTISLNCAVLGNGPGKIFTVEIPSDKNISILKNLIKEKQPIIFSDTPATDIQLFKVSLSEAELKKQGGASGKVDPTQELSSALARISVVFKDVLDDEVHVIALVPTGTGKHKRVSSLSPELRQGLHTAWTREYQGSTHRILLDNILSDPRKLPYCNTGAIIQSSGYGKSRTVDELAKLVFTIPMNLRAAAETEQGAYPHPDTDIANLIRSTSTATSDDNRVKMFHILFCTLFNRILAELDTIRLGSHIQAEVFATRWREHLLQDDNRSNLYSSVIKDTKQQWFQEVLPPSAESDAKAALTKLIGRIPAVGDDDNPLSVVMYVDEAHELEVRTEKSTLYDLLTMAVSEYGHKIFILFLSTVSRTRQPAPLKKITRSNRTILAGDLIPPYTEMPFDYHPTLLSPSPRTLTLTDVQNFGFITRFGRPLFWSMLEAAQQRSPSSDPDVKIRTFAMQKLTNSTSILDLEPLAKLAILDTILNLEYQPFRAQTALLMEDMVSSHMRTAFSAPKHREYLHTGYPSEPVLADAAMQALYLTETTGGRVVDAAAEFFSSLDSGPTKGAIDMGQRGENVAKMILVRAYMSAVRAEHSPPSFDGPNWSSGCSLVAFLTSLTGRDFQELVLHCKPNNLPRSYGQPLRNAFVTSRVRFTHFVRAADDAAVTTSAACVAFVRAMSFIGWSSQKSVDVCIPILLDSDKPVTEANMSAILVQIKLRSKKGSYDIDAKKIGLFPPRGSSRDCTKMAEMAEMEVEPEKYFTRPYISLVMELGVEKLHDAHPAHVQAHLDRPPVPKSNKDRTSVPTSNKSSHPPICVVARTPPTRITSRATSKVKIPEIHPGYSLCFYGCTPEVYGCIPEKAEHIYKSLLQLSILVPEHPRSSSLHAVLRMKPFWSANSRSYDYSGNSWLKLKPDENEVKGEEEEEEEEEVWDMALEKVQEHVPTRSEDEQNLGMDLS